MTGGEPGDMRDDGPPHDTPDLDPVPASGPAARSDNPATRESSPSLPQAVAATKPATVAVGHPDASSATWYRSDDDRKKSVSRRANPLWRRLLRGLIAGCLIAVVGVGLYFGARLAQDYLDRNQLPPVGTEIPDIASSTFQLASSAPAPTVDGTVTIDLASGAFEFVGTGTQAGTEVVSPDGTTVFIRAVNGVWRPAGVGDSVAAGVTAAIPFLIAVESSDDVLPKDLRDNFVELIDQVDEGTGDTQLTRYEMEFDMNGFSDHKPFHWDAYASKIMPALPEANVVPVTMWLDTKSVVVRLTDRAGWAWQRLTYTDEPFSPIDPGATLVVTVDP